MRGRFVAFLAGVIITALLSLLLFLYWTKHKMTKIHELEFPLLLSSDRESKIAHMLPAGTTMYFDQAYSEGFTRYKVYINVDRLPLGLKELNDPTMIIPIEGAALGGAELKKLLSDYPLTKNDLEAILKSGKITREEIKALLTEYSK
jgi:hypothetical protein